MRGVAAVLAKLVRRQLAHVGEPLLDKLNGVFVGFFKVIRAIIKTVAPVEAEPVDVLLDRLHELGILLGGIGVVHAQVADPAEVLRRAEVDGQGLAVADVEVAVRLGREAGVDLHPGELAALCDVFLYKSVDKVSGVLFHGVSPFCRLAAFTD